ncbi:MAG: dCTP deaminase [Thermogemmatispora sp.]|jgi:dCTP deaminase|uniref:dCTP deaminase n=1 Tax=Thermogemmatispora aurantia TaxID=2045279 RepID=A0A5J4K7L1_9CHLR|nr:MULTISPECIES: dCTP deaminase [Thermogemmatispora]MBE3564407.1 dCTP deaminase [Thermogemmatispora sp.]GER82679.1 dCTP deaminase [Thermogemmatispora aurantia]
MILSDRDLKALLAAGLLVVEPWEERQLGPTSIDLRLGARLVKYRGERLELGKAPPASEEIMIDPHHGYELRPGEFILGCTLERVRIPNGYQGFIETKGDVARAGLQVHNGDGHVDPGSDHVLTLEITNLNSIPVVLYPGLFICQLFIHQLSSLCLREYRGKYFGQQGPTVYQPA